MNTGLGIPLTRPLVEDPLEDVKIVTGIEPKKKSKIKFVQWILIKIYGYKLTYKTVKAHKIDVKAEDCPKEWDVTLTFTLGEEEDV